MENQSLTAWVDDVARLTKPDRVVWCDGSEEEYRSLVGQMLADGTLLELNHDQYPNCYLHRSNPTDVARTEHLTFICCEQEKDAGPTNNWLSPDAARAKVGPLFEGAMKGRTMYVVPYLMGPVGSPSSKVGIEITDSPYVVANMKIMTRMGKVALDALAAQGPTSEDYCKGLHSLGDLSPDRRFICHFPQDKLIWSIGSGYGGNALLGKKCFALRIASTMARDEGWLAEHMLILGLEDPTGKVTYICAAFPSACGKTNLAMLIAPLSQKGWKVWTVGDDIAWLRVGEDGRLWAVNPEAGFFGVAPGTSEKTNPNALASLHSNSIFTNVALAPDKTPWWEGLTKDPPAGLIDWKGNPWDGKDKAAQPNSRFTAPASQCPCVSPEFNSPTGVPISAIIFGGRRAKLAPLVYEARDWEHGVFLGATLSSETTAAATGQTGIVRRDPMAMRPFCGYNMGDYFAHWMKLGEGKTAFPKIFHINWFRTDEAGKFLWPGFGDNMRVLRWVHGRVNGTAEARDAEIGLLPTEGGIDVSGLSMAPGAMDELLAIDRAAWQEEVKDQEGFLKSFGEHTPEALWKQHATLKARLDG